MKRLAYLIPLSAMAVLLFVSVAVAQSSPNQSVPDQYGAAQGAPTPSSPDQGIATQEDAPQDTVQNTQSLNIEPFGFYPAHKHVPPGTTISWFNIDSKPHTVTADDGSFDSGELRAGETFAVTFDQGPGKWSYHSELDPNWGGGSIIVDDPSGGGSTSLGGSPDNPTQT
jgi:plastocyanin